MDSTLSKKGSDPFQQSRIWLGIGFEREGQTPLLTKPNNGRMNDSAKTRPACAAVGTATHLVAL